MIFARAHTSAQDGCAEMLAAIRRGPGSPSTSDEQIEYLMQRRRHDQERPPAENYSLEHVRRRKKTADDRATHDTAAIATRTPIRLWSLATSAASTQ